MKVCEEHKKEFDKLNSVIVLYQLRGYEYDAVPFKRCPWCETDKEENKIKNEQIN